MSEWESSVSQREIHRMHVVRLIVDVNRICSFSYQATVGSDNPVRLGGIILEIPPGLHHRGYAKARVEVRQLLDGCWRVYHKDELLVETTPPVIQAPLRILWRKYRKSKAGKTAGRKVITRNDRLRSR